MSQICYPEFDSECPLKQCSIKSICAINVLGSRGSKTGKYSHGGPADTSRRLPAKCGINKDTTVEILSPHYHLHNYAYLATVAATKNFLIDKGKLIKEP